MQETSNLEIFKSLRGQWRIKRSLVSQPGFGFSGMLEGLATFSPRKPTAHSTSLELLYSESGELKTENGLTLQANRKYVYRYSADEDKISVWFVKEKTKDFKGFEEVDYLFMDLEVKQHNETTIGRGDHLCSKDMYWAEYQWRMPGAAADDDNDEDEEEELQVWGLRYKVKGPQKDYTSDTAYERVVP
ncbi:hypothetical protein AMS68_005290 [Peltaster fructicola]|uniref:DUF6314 domain-containing protein n=1 Tax=Peltaster fructicola TaxID=286661 RepID=A0A6H0XYD8_9PEZI|nr:hypothetical protein AMS68_005290 [Peltaster fructicola]